MSASEQSPTDELVQDESAQSTGTSVAEAEDTGEPLKLNLDVKIESRGACQRHITVSIPRSDVDRYLKDAFSKLVDKAAVPGFRAGRAPRKLVEARFRKDITDQVKGSLLVDSLSQITEDHQLAAISEPDFDPLSVVVPDEGPMTYEFDLEVRPEFDLPEWRGLTIERPLQEFTEKEVDERLRVLLAERGQLVPFDGAAETGDYLAVNLTFKHGERVLSSSPDEVIRIRPVISFHDGKIENFDKLMVGVKAGETRIGTAKLTMDAPNRALRGQEVSAVFEVLEVKRLELPELSPGLLAELGDFESEAELRKAVRESLERQLQYQQQQFVRQQVTAALTKSADWELPPDMLRRQARRELERAVLELRRNGFSDKEINARANDLRQNSAVSTARALKEHFILERLAEDQKIEDLPEDYDLEIELLAEQSGESARRVRAQLEKRGLMDSLRNQIIERKVIELILSHATFKDVQYKPESVEAEALDQAAGGGDAEESSIPEAKFAGDSPPLPDAAD